MKINLHIDRLLLEGDFIAPHQQQTLRRTVEAELGHLVTQGLASAVFVSDKIRVAQGGPIVLKNGMGAKGLGKQIAGAIYKGIKK